MRSTFVLACLSAFAFAAVYAGSRCWVGSVDTVGKFPTDAIKANESKFPEEATACAKVYLLRTDGSPIPFLRFNWQEFEIDGMGTFFQCGETFEYSVTAVFREYGAYYYRVCTCCGDYCNDASMDDKCNETPVFTSKCRSSNHLQPDSGTDPKVEVSAQFTTSITDTQCCYKATSIDDKKRYIWGGASFKHCGAAYTYHEAHGSYRACTCNGKNCNDGRMNEILLGDKDCSGEHGSARAIGISFLSLFASLIAYILLL